MKSIYRRFLFTSAAFVGLSLTTGQALADFSIYVEYNGSGVGSIMKYDSAGNGTLFASGFSFPEGLVQDSLGNFYLVDENVGHLLKITPGGVVSTLANTGIAPYDVAIDVSGNLYVANYVAGNIQKFSSTGTNLGTFIGSGLNNPDGLVFDTAGNLYVSNYSGASVNKYSPTGTLLATLTTGAGPQGMAFDAAGNLYVANSFAHTVQKFSPTGTDLGVFISGINQPTDLAFDPNGNLYVTDWGFTSQVLKYNSAGVSQGVFATGAYATGILIVAPEPASTLLLGLAGGALLGLRRKRQRQ